MFKLPLPLTLPLLALVVSCTVTERVESAHAPIAELALIPVPVDLQLSGDTCRLAASDLHRVQLSAQHYDAVLGAEGYRLSISAQGVMLTANTAAGLWNAQATLRQFLPPQFPGFERFGGVWQLPCAEVVDYPRFAWRGYMLDVARHFFPVAELKRWMDVLASYKINRLHLHLTDDQGWRLAMRGWPRLTEIGGAGAVGDAPGGYYTAEDYAVLERYAADRAMVLVPEIDMPGHVHAALASYAELNCSGEAPEPYTGTQVGLSSLCLAADATATTYGFATDMVRELAAATAGPYLHVGADEAHQTAEEDYRAFVQHVQAVVADAGRVMVAWEEAAQAEVSSATLLQVWINSLDVSQLNSDVRLIASPATRAYLDMRYDADTTWGTVWAGYVSLERAYDWDPVTEIAGASESRVIGVEGAMWTENVPDAAAVEFMSFPRVLGYAEIGWSPREGRNWSQFRDRLASHGSRLRAAGVQYYADPSLDWR